MLITGLLGRWYGRHGRHWVVVEFRDDGRVEWITLDSNKWPRESREYWYRFDSGRLAIHQDPPLREEIMPISFAEPGWLRFKFGNAKVVLVPGLSLLGRWVGRFGDRPAGAEFHPDGRLEWTIIGRDGTVSQVLHATYWVAEGILSTQERPDLQVDRSPIFFDRPGWLALKVGGRSVRLVRPTS